MDVGSCPSFSLSTFPSSLTIVYLAQTPKHVHCDYPVSITGLGLFWEHPRLPGASGSVWYLQLFYTPWPSTKGMSQSIRDNPFSPYETTDPTSARWEVMVAHKREMLPPSLKVLLVKIEPNISKPMEQIPLLPVQGTKLLTFSFC